jgi:UDP-glucose 4-epimerase
LICNLGSGGGFSIRQVIDAAADAVGHDIPFSVGARRAGDPPVLVAQSTRAAEVLGWHATRSTLDEMIGSAWAWRQSHPDGYPD